MRFTRGFRVRSTLALMSAALLAAPAFAQETDAEEEDALDLGKITVTATKRKSLLMETPVAVSALSQDDLDRRGVSNMLDIGDMVPSVQIGFSPSDSGVQVTVRGVTSNNFTEIGDPTVGIHVDGIYSPRPQAGLALMYDVERIEVLRGPQGTLFGRNSTSGAVNIINARPDFMGVTGRAEVETGEYNLIAGRGVLNWPISDTFAVRGSFMFEQRDGWIVQEKDEYDLQFDTDGDGRFDGVFDVARDGIPNTDQRRNRDVGKSDYYTNLDRWAARVSARWSPTYKFDWQITYDHFQDKSAGGISMKDCEKARGTFFECDHPDYYASVNIPGEMDFTIDTVRSQITWDMTDSIILEHRIAFASQERFQQWDGDAGAFADPDHPAYGFGRQIGDQDFGLLVNDLELIRELGFDDFNYLPWEDIQLTTRSSKYDSIVSELQFKSSDEDRLQWVGGLFYLKEDNAIRFDVEIPFCCGVVRPLGQSFVQPDRQVESQAIFGQIDYAITPWLNFTLGYRHTWDEKSDTGGSNHETIGYWVNPALWDPDNTFWHESYALIGIEPNWGQGLCDGINCMYQSNNFTDIMGSLAENFPDRIPGTDNTFRGKWDKGTWKVGLDYTINERWFAYGYVATGFKAGGFGDKIDVCECGIFTAFPYDPEEVTTYELGFKAALADNFNLLGNVFFSQYDDMQRTQWVIVGESVNSGRDIGTLLTTNLAESEIFGVEVEIDWRPWEGGRIFGWLTYLDAEITSQPGAEDGWFCFERALLGLSPCPAEDPDQERPDGSPRRPADFVGNQLPWSPKWSTTINVEHSWFLENNLRLSPFLSVHWQDEMFFSDNNFDEDPFHAGQEAFATADIALRLISEQRRWAVEAYVRNVTDEIVRSWSDPGPGYLRANFFPPRMWGVKFRKDF